MIPLLGRSSAALAAVCLACGGNSSPPPPDEAEPQPVAAGIYIEDRPCVVDGLASGVYALRPAGRDDFLAESLSPERGTLAVAVVDGCIGIARGEHMTTLGPPDDKGSLAFDVTILATGDSLGLVVVVDKDKMVVHRFHERRGERSIVENGIVLDGTGPLELVLPLATASDSEIQGLLSHELAAVRAAALERLLPHQADPTTCRALSNFLT